MVNTVLSWMANIVFCIRLIIQPRYFSNHLSKKNLRRLTTEYRAKVKAKSGLKKEKAKKAFLWKVINTVNDTEPQVWLCICRQILQKENQCASNRVIASQLQIHLSFPFCENRSGPFKYSSFVTGSVNRGCCRDRRKGLLLSSSGLAPSPAERKPSCTTGFCPGSSSDRLP